MIRDDLSDRLVHLVKGETGFVAYCNLLQILAQKTLRGGTGFIRSGEQCVCFTETPLASIAQTAASQPEGRYYPAGIMVSKTWLFARGGRPVIYQPDAEYPWLPPELRYRHVRYEPDDEIHTVDFTWEREWRIKTPDLHIEPREVTVVLPTRRWAGWLIDHHYERIRNRVEEIAISSPEYAHTEVQPLLWHFVVLEDLGVPISSDWS